MLSRSEPMVWHWVIDDINMLIEKDGGKASYTNKAIYTLRYWAKTKAGASPLHQYFYTNYCYLPAINFQVGEVCSILLCQSEDFVF
jgi:hypothetical protein